MKEKKNDKKNNKNFFKQMNYEIAGEHGIIDNEDMKNNRKLNNKDRQDQKDNKK